MQKTIVTARVKSDLDAAENAYHAARYENAATLYKAALRDAPPSLANAISMNMALALYHLGRYDEAHEHLTRIVTEEPDNVLALLNLGFVYQESGDNEEAISLYYKAIAINPDNANVWENLGKALGQTYRFSDAIAAYSHVLLINPNDLNASLQIACLLSAWGQIDESIREFKTYLLKAPRDYDGFYFLSLAHLLKLQSRTNTSARWGDLSRGFSALSKAFSINPRRPETWFAFNQIVGVFIKLVLIAPLITILKILIKR